MNGKTKIAAAIGAVLAACASGSALAAPPTLGAAQSSTNTLYAAGSSAAKSAFISAVQNDICGGSANALTFSSTGDTNFFAVSCAALQSTGIVNANGTNVFTIYYRDEGGSVTGALPLVSGSAIQQLNLSNGSASCTGATCTISVGGSTTANGTTDTFSGTLPQKVGLGITDVEPGALSGDNYPSAYSPSAYGKASATQLSGLTSTAAFQQVFGIFVNKTNLNTPICLTTEQVAGLLGGSTTDWHKVEDCATHQPVASSSQLVTIVNREAGSGTRTAASIFWLNDECNPNAAGVLEDQTVDYFSTGNVLAAAATTNGAITYASIDNNGAQANLVMAAINGVTPSNLAAAQGSYPWWEEATTVQPNYSIPAVASSIASFLVTDLANGNTAPHSAQVNLIPGAGTNTTPSLPVSGTANQCTSATCTVKTATAIYINPFTKSQSACAAPTQAIF